MARRKKTAALLSRGVAEESVSRTLVDPAFVALVIEALQNFRLVKIFQLLLGIRTLEPEVLCLRGNYK